MALLAPRNDPTAAATSQLVPVKRKIPVACTTCRRKKAKCNGEHPCQTCLKFKLECVFRPDTDGRRHNDLKKRAFAAEEDSQRLRKVFHLIKKGDAREIEGIVSLIRTSTSPAFLEAQLERSFEDQRSTSEGHGDTGTSLIDTSPAERRISSEGQYYDSIPQHRDIATRPFTPGLILSVPPDGPRAHSVVELDARSPWPRSAAGIESNASEYYEHQQQFTAPGNASLSNSQSHSWPHALGGATHEESAMSRLSRGNGGDKSSFGQSLPHVSEVRSRETPGLPPTRSENELANHHHLCLWSYLKLSEDWHPVLAANMEHLAAVNCICWRFNSSSDKDSNCGAASYPPAHLLSEYVPSTAHTQQPPRNYQPALSNAFGNMPGSSAVRSGGFSCSIQEQQLQLYERPEWSILPIAFDDGSPFCRAYLSYVEAAKAMIRTGSPQQEIFGNERTNVDWFFRPRCKVEANTVGECACTLFAVLTEVEAALRLGWILSAVRLMKWLITPSVETYAKLSSFERPTLVQRMLPHSAAIDLVPRPDVRDALCRMPRDFIMPSKGCSINWPMRLDEAVLINYTDGSTYVTDAFEAHALDHRNWTYSVEYVRAFPEIQEGALRVRNG